MGSIRNFIRALLRDEGPKAIRHQGHDLASDIRENIGPLVGKGRKSMVIPEAIVRHSTRRKSK